MGELVHQVQIEVILLSVSDDTQLTWRAACGDLPAGCRPMFRARELAAWALTCPSGQSCTRRHGDRPPVG